MPIEIKEIQIKVRVEEPVQAAQAATAKNQEAQRKEADKNLDTILEQVSAILQQQKER